MDTRRSARSVVDPKVRQVGFLALGAAPPFNSSQTGPPDPPISSSTPTITDLSPPDGNSLSPVMIPPPRHSSAPLSPLRRDSLVVGSYTASDFMPATSPTTTASLSDDVASVGLAAGKGGKVGASSSFSPRGGFHATAAKAAVPASQLMTVSVVNLPLGLSGMFPVAFVCRFVHRVYRRKAV